MERTVKRVVSLLLCMALLLSQGITAFAANTKSSEPLCPKCGAVTWTQWDGTAPTTDAHVYIPEGGQTVGGNDLNNATHFVIDLRGNALTCTSQLFRVKNAGVDLYLMDSVGTGTLTAKGNSERHGGIIQIMAAGKITITGGTYSLAADETFKETNNGGLFNFNSGANGTLTITGGEFNAHSAKNGDSIFVTGAGNTLEIGGTAVIHGGVQCNSAKAVILSGTPTIRKQKGGSAYSLKLAAGVLVDATGLEAGADVGITLAENGIFTTELESASAATAMKSCFTADDPEKKIYAVGNTLQLADKPEESGSIFNYEVADGEVTITGLREAVSGELIIPATLDGYPITAIGYRAFDYCESLTNVVLPEGLTSIGGLAFIGCSSLESVNIPDSVTSIGSQAFSYCYSLESITIPGSVTNMESAVFRGSSLTGIWVDEKNQYYSNDAAGVLFNKDKTVLIAAPGGISGGYVIPDSVTSIGEGAFHSCDNLESIIIPDGITSIVRFAFYSCDSLTSITIPDSVTKIDFRALAYCTSLESITIPKRVTNIGEDALSGCSSLKTITIPESVTSINMYAFYGCSSLTDIYYAGTQDQWNAISVGQNNEELTSATIHYEWTGETEPQIPGDFNGDNVATDADALYLLRHTLFEDRYPISGNGDVNGDGMLTDADALYLLRYTLFPERYPLYPKG